MGWAQKEEDESERRNRQTARQRPTPFLGGHTQTASKKIDLVEESEVKSGERSVALNKCLPLQSRIHAWLNDSVVAFLRFASCEEGS